MLLFDIRSDLHCNSAAPILPMKSPSALAELSFPLPTLSLSLSLSALSGGASLVLQNKV